MLVVNWNLLGRGEDAVHGKTGAEMWKEEMDANQHIAELVVYISEGSGETCSYFSRGSGLMREKVALYSRSHVYTGIYCCTDRDV